MADLKDVLPNFDTQPWRHLTYSLEKKNVLTAELIAQDPVDIARRCPLPLREVKRFVEALNAAIRTEIIPISRTSQTKLQEKDGEPARKKARTKHTTEHTDRKQRMTFVKTLDDNIDRCLGGGFPTGHICEIVGER